MQGHFDTTHGPLPKTRHAHPFEIALINGVMPQRDWGTNLRMAIASLGQMASPIQSCWIAAQYVTHVFPTDMIDLTPEAILWNHFEGLFAGVRKGQTHVYKHERFQRYMACVHGTLFPDLGYSMPPASVDHHWPQNLDNSQRAGRKDPEEKKSGVTSSSVVDTKQPAEGSQEPLQEDMVPPETLDQLFSRSSSPRGQGHLFMHIIRSSSPL